MPRAETIYLDGVLAESGTFDNWGTDQELSLANEESDDREWLGDLHLVAIDPSVALSLVLRASRRALSAAEVDQNYDSGSGRNTQQTVDLPPAGCQKIPT